MQAKLQLIVNTTTKLSSFKEFSISIKKLNGYICSKKVYDYVNFRFIEISEEEYQEILENPMKYPINPPYLYIKRVERLYDLGRMIYADKHLGDRQEKLLKKLALRLGFTPGNVNYIVDKALKVIESGADLEEFVFEIRNMNK